ncbi:SMI1/KNR4 family protein [Paenibacillus spiritus]|uniref:SMI1/KNR4 family protein n=1 Tax=Paenibacillus spiritus TaxID=2496557 RepID=A0A5J5FW90_9BACL|nr:SMI1/KNR4 family protein [Paenibacillus spiritus]KAA8997578.1 SMI1/KNR4 family protein [Paenibacillus spiritus]
MLQSLLQEYLTLSESLRPGYIASLGQGGPEAAAKLEASVPDAPELLRVIYGTVKGTDSGLEEARLIEFMPGYRLIHIDEYEAERRALAAVLRDKGVEGGERLLPVLANYGGDYICWMRDSEGAERLCDVLADYGDPMIMFDSPELFLRTLCAFYRESVYAADEEGYLDSDLIREGEVAAELNPQSPYWTEQELGE